MNHLSPTVRIVEVGPRDGLQNEPGVISVETKLRLIRGLIEAGLKTIEAGSFVNPQRVPQMAGTDQLFQQLPDTTDVTFTALTPNRKGLQRAIDVGAKEVAIFPAATETFSMKNLNCTIEQSLQRFEEVAVHAAAEGLRVRGCVSCAVACPYEGITDLEQVRLIAERLLAVGCYEISLCDTIGVATPDKISALVTHVGQSVDCSRLALHLHDTYGQAVANIYAGLQAGITVFDTSIAGLGGCPFAPGASGNVATEDVVYLLDGLGIEHGLDLSALIALGSTISSQLGRSYGAKAGAALLAKQQHP